MKISNKNKMIALSRKSNVVCTLTSFIAVEKREQVIIAQYNCIR